MRFPTNAAAIALLSAPGLVSAAGKLGFSLGAKNPDGACKLTADYEADFDAIAAETDSKIVRIYAAGQCDTAANILPAAKTKGFQVVLGVWPDTEDSYQLDKNAILAHAPGYYDQVWAITVGSESLYRGTFTGDQLVEKINDLRSAAPQFWYGTADSWNKFQDGTADAVISASDILLVNAFPYWQGDTVADSWATLTTDTDQAWDRIVSVVGDNPLPEVWIGETGWPSEGTKYQNAEPGLENAETFYQDSICGKLNENWNTFAFEAFDEPWKPLSTGDDGSQADETHWGVMYADRSPKYGLRC